MKYPFSPELLDSLPEGLAELFRNLELKLLLEICFRLKIGGQLNEVTVQNIRALRSHGISLREIEKAIRETTDLGEDKLNELLDDVIEQNQAYYTELIDLAQVTAPQTLVDARDIEAIRRQTVAEFRNLTQSMGFTVNKGRTRLMPAKAYQWILDSAVLQVQSGAIDYNTAIRDAVRQLAASGLMTDRYGNKNIVQYESGHRDQLDVAIRRATMTGVNQINQKYREQSMEYLGTDLVETTAHAGARDIDGPKGWENHKAWQGRVYRWAKKPHSAKGEYPDFEQNCGYGDVQGIGGANCRHSFYAFIEGTMERTYTDDQLAAIDRPPFKFEDRTYTAYQATQKQREIERTIRRLKREKTAFEAAGLQGDAQAVNIRLQRLRAKYKEFSKAAGLPEQLERMMVTYTDGFSESKAVALKTQRAAEAPIREAIKNGEYPLVINSEKQARHMEGTATPGKSVITIPQNELQDIVNKRAGSGKITFDKNGDWNKREIIDAEREIGYTVNREGVIMKTSKLKIHYSKTGIHMVPFSGRY